jgi:hypothetical protein
LRLPYGEGRISDNRRNGCERAPAQQDAAAVDGALFPIRPIAHDLFLSRITQRKPTWLVFAGERVTLGGKPDHGLAKP